MIAASIMPANYASKFLNKVCWCMVWGFLACYFTRYLHAHNFMWLWAVICVWFLYKALKQAYRLFIQGRYQAKLRHQIESVTDNHGSAEWSTEEQIKAKGFDNPNNGVPIGVLGSTPIFYNYTHGLTVSAAGGGKTVSGTLTAIAHGYRVELDDGSSYAVPQINVDVKKEICPSTKALIENHHEHHVVILNPEQSDGYPDTGFNPCYIIVDDMADPTRYKHAISDAIEMIFLLIPEPDGGVDKNVFWRNGSRVIMLVVVIYLAAVVPDDCHLAELFTIVTDFEKLVDLLNAASQTVILSGDLATIANGLLHTEEEQFASFVTGAAQVLLPFSKSSALGQSVSRDNFRFESIRDPKQLTSVFIIAPYEHRQAYATWTGLVIKSATKALIRMGVNSPVQFNIDEATNFNLHGLAQDLTALRGYGLRCRLWIQTKSEAIRVIGEHSTETLYSQTDLKQFFKITSYKEAQEISNYLGEYTVKVLNIGAESSSLSSDLKPSWSEQGKPSYRPEDILNMAEDEQIVLMEGLLPTKCKRLPYNNSKTWHELMDDNPVEGGKLPLQDKFDICYEEVSA